MKKNLLRLLALCFFTATSITTSRATTYVWYGLYYQEYQYYSYLDNSWQNPYNWIPVGVPGPGDTAIITNSYTPVYLNNSISVSNIIVGDGTCTNGSGSLYINGKTINLLGTLAVQSCGYFDFSSGSINALGSGATLSNVTMYGSGQISGTINIATNGNFNIISAVDHNIPSMTINNYGTVNWSAGRIRGGAYNGTIINNYGVWDSHGDLNFNVDLGADGFVFNNYGTFLKSAGTGSTTLSGVPFNNSGIVDVETGNVSLPSGGVLSGGYQTGPGTMTLGGGGFNLNGMTTTTNTYFTGAYFYGPTVINGVLQWYSGTMDTGSILITSNSVLNVVSAADHDIGYSTITNYGTVEWIGPGRIRGGGIPGTVVYNYGLWDAQGNWTFNDDLGNDGTVFYNLGTFRASAGAGTMSFGSGVYFSSTGTVDIESGALSFGGGAAFTGGTNIGPGQLVMAGGGFNVSGGFGSTNAYLTGGVLVGDNVINGVYYWYSGVWNSAASVTIATNSTLYVPGGADHDIGYINVTNSGTVAWSAGRIRGGGVPGTAVYNYGLWDAQADLVFNDDLGNDGTIFNNYGTFRKSGGTNTTTVATGVYVYNFGTVDVESGSAAFNGGVGNTGTLNIVSNSVVYLGGGGTLTGGAQTGGGFIQSSGGYLNVNGTTTTPNFQMTGGSLYGSNYFSGGLYWYGGDWNSASAVTIPTNTFLYILSVADHNMASCTLNNYGTTYWSAGRIRTGSIPGTTINNYGTFDSQADLVMNFEYGNVGTVFNNYGTFRKSGGTGNTSLSAGIYVMSSGQVDVETGTVSFNGGLGNSGNINVVTNSVLYLGAGGTLTGGHETGGGTIQSTGGSLNVNGFTANPNLQMTGGSLYGSNYFGGGFYWYGGNWNSASAVTIPTNTTLYILSTVDHDLASCTLNNYGTVSWSAGRLRGGGNPTTIYNNYGTFDSQADLVFNSDYAVNGFIFNNRGTFRKSGGTGATSFGASGIGVSFRSSGLVDIQTGQLNFGGGGAFTGGSISGTSGLAYLLGGPFSFNNTLTTTNVIEAGGYLVGANTLTPGFTWSSGNWNSAPQVTIPANSTVVCNSGADHDLASCTVSNFGNFIWVSGRLRGGSNPGTFVYNYGVWDAQSDYAFNSDYAVNGFIFKNFGYLRKSGGTVGTTFTAAGIGANFYNTGIISNLTVGPIYLSGGGYLTGGSISGPAILNAGYFNINGTVTSTNVQESGASLSGSNVISGGLVFNSGNWNSASYVTVLTNSELDIASGADHDMVDTTLNNYGKVVWLGGRIRGGGFPATVINNHGVWDTQCDYVFNSDFGSHGLIFNNYGFFDKRNTTGTTSWTATAGNSAFNDFGGSMEIDSGTFSYSGSIYCPAGGITFGLGGTNAGQYGRLIASGIAYVGGPLTVYLTNGFVPHKPQQFPIVSSALGSGVFSSTALPSGLGINYTNNTVLLVATNAVPVQLAAQLSGKVLLVSFPTVSGQSYVIQTTTNLLNPNWTTFLSVPGSGSTQLYGIAVTNTIPQIYVRVYEP